VHQDLPQDAFHEMILKYVKAFVHVACELKHHGFSKHNSRSEKFQAAGIVYLQRPQSSEHQHSDTYPL